MTVSLVAYGLGNLGSVANMLKRVGAETRLVSTPEEILASDRLLLPGIGAFDTGMRLLDDQGLTRRINEFAATGRPVFGICLGMQLLLDGSEEGSGRPRPDPRARASRFADRRTCGCRTWAGTSSTPTRDDPLVAGLEPDSRFYFVHSYQVVPSATRRRPWRPRATASRSPR